MQAQFEKLIEEFSASLQFEKTALNDEHECVLGIDETVVRIALNGEHIVVYASFGTIPDHCREEMCCRLLMGNYFYAETGGASLGISPTTQDIQLIYREKFRDVDCGVLHNIVENFMQRIEYWKSKCENLASSLEIKDAGQSEDFTASQTFLKV